MSDFDLMKAIESAAVKIDLGKAVFAIFDVDGQEVVAGYKENVNNPPGIWQNWEWAFPYPSALLRQESEVKNMVEETISRDMANGDGDRISAILLGIDATRLAFGEGLIVDNRVDLENGRYIGRILALGRVWKFISEVDTVILPNSFSVATVDSSLNII